MFAGIDCIKSEAGGGAGIDVGGVFQMIGVRAEAVAPAFLKHSPRRIVHHLLRSAASPGVLAYRLLRQDGRHRRAPDGANVPRRGETQTVAASSRFFQTERTRDEKRKDLAERRGVLRRRLA